MKKILLTCAIVFIATLTYAQRVADLSITLNTPAAGSKIRTGVAFNMNITYKNNGPDVIKTTDTILFVWGVGTTYFPNTAAFLPHPNDLAVGDTMNVTVNNQMLNGGNGAAMNLCAYAVLFNAEQPDSVNDNRLGGNNQSCKSINYSGVGIGEIKANVKSFETSSYPNPASSLMTVEFNAESNESFAVVIYDLQGRVISTVENVASVNGAQSVDLNVSNLSKGIYIYTVTKAGNISSSKFTVE